MVSGFSRTTAKEASPLAEYVQRLRTLVGGEELLQIPSVSIALRDPEGRVLLARQAEGDVWLLPGGAIEPAETPADAAVREMFEETGLLVRLTSLVLPTVFHRVPASAFRQATWLPLRS